MDTKHFDTLVRDFATASSRRGLARVVTGLLLTGPLTPLLAVSEAETKKKRKKKKRKKKKRPACAPQCDGKQCGNDGCGGTCGECGGDTSCQSGACVCPTACCSNEDCGFQGACESGICDCKSGARFCQDTCIPEDDCCTDEECPAGSGQTCQDGQCACPGGKKDCSGDCIPQNACCDDDDCGACEICQDQTCVASACCPLCPDGQDCLSNGSCATVCVEQADCTGCGGGCSFASVEGPKHCIAPVSFCEDFPQECESTAECPTGQHCQHTSCSGGQNRCWPLCNP